LKDPNEILKGGISNRGHLGRLTGVAYFQVFSFPTEIWNRMGRQGCDYQKELAIENIVVFPAANHLT
jgi:hypothetical protein